MRVFSLFVSVSLFILSLCGLSGCHCYEQARAEGSFSVSIKFSLLASTDLRMPWMELVALSPSATCSVPPAGWAAGSSSALSYFSPCFNFSLEVERQCPLFSSTSFRLGQVGPEPCASQDPALTLPSWIPCKGEQVCGIKGSCLSSAYALPCHF